MEMLPMKKKIEGWSNVEELGENAKWINEATGGEGKWGDKYLRWFME